ALAIGAAECLSGRRPFQATGLGQLLASIITGPTPAIEQLYPAATPVLAKWWQQATARDPKERFGSARELAEELSVALGVKATPTSQPEAVVPSQRSQRANGGVATRSVTDTSSGRGEPLSATSSLSPVTAAPLRPQHAT